jgi:hypothetical protein
VNSRAAETQQLIADIDRLITNKRLSRFLSSQASEPRQVLERIRGFLVNLSENEAQNQPQQSPLLAKFVEQNHQSLPQQQELQQEKGTDVVAGQQSHPLAAVLAPLQEDIKTLLQERANLAEEIRQLEQKRLHNYSLAQQLANQEQIIAEFLQVLENRIVSTTSQVAETTANFPMQPFFQVDPETPFPGNNENKQSPISSTPSVLESPDQVEQLSRFAKDLDQKLLALDGTVNVVFEALQRNIHTYHESLSQALARMHTQGVQGEQLLASLISNLTSQLQQQIPTHLLSTQDVRETTQPTSQQLASLPEFQQLEASSLIQNNQSVSLAEDIASTSELDAVLFQVKQDAQNSIDTPTGRLHQNHSPSTPDEVDKLYASLFGVEVTDAIAAEAYVPNLTKESSIIHDFFDEQRTTPSAETDDAVADVIDKISVDSSVASSVETPTNQQQSEFPYEVVFEAPEITTDEAADVTDVPEELPVEQASPILQSSLSETASDAATIEEQPVDSTVDLCDPWLEEPKADVELSSNDAEETQNISLATEQSSSQENTLTELASVEGLQVVSLDGNQLNPANEDTITTLTDLFVDFSQEQSLDSSSETAENIETPQEETIVAETAEQQIENRDSEPSLENYTPASPQEMLSEAENQSPEIVDISLEEAQLQQLEQDLASFDGEINALLQPLSQPDQENPQQSLLEQVETESEPNTMAAQAAEVEKKSIGEETSESSSVSSSNSTNDTSALPNPRQPVWYLGIDLGTTGISAALLNRSTTEVYPLYWSAETQEEATSIKRSFRLPAEVYLPTASVIETESKEAHEQTAPAAVAEEKVPEEMVTDSPPTEAEAPVNNIFSAQLKPYLQLALPYKSNQLRSTGGDRSYWEPVLQLNESATVPLVWVVRSLSKLLLTLMSDSSSTTLGLTAAATGLDEQTFKSIMSNMTGVICTCPSHWSEQYRFNIREAILISKLVQHPQQVFFLEEGIACLLCELDGAEGEKVTIRSRQGSRPARTSERSLVGNTLVLNIGAGATEMALVELPENLEDLTHGDFMLHSFAYAGKGLEQDIISQLLFPTKWRQSRINGQEDSTNVTNKPWQWQPSIPGLDQMRFSSLRLEELNLPRPGEPDIVERIHLQQRLESSVLGKAVIDAAIALKLILQHHESFILELADQRWGLQRRDLESQVFVPFVRRLNRELNKLLVAKGIPTEAINQAILTGGVASLGAVSRWLRQKLPNAKIIQDVSLGENGPTCSRVAFGLALLPLHPQVLEVPRQQYTDYFLFTELLRILPSRAVSFGEVIQLFENRGINTRSCQQRLLAFLEGELPAGLIPTSIDAVWLTQTSGENPDYKASTTAPLFEKQGSLTYRPNVEQIETVARYLDAIKASTQQSLEEPYTVNFALGVVD